MCSPIIVPLPTPVPCPLALLIKNKEGYKKYIKCFPILGNIYSVYYVCVCNVSVCVHMCICISYSLLCNKLALNFMASNSKHLLSHSFCVSGFGSSLAGWFQLRVAHVIGARMLA